MRAIILPQGWHPYSMLHQKLFQASVWSESLSYHAEKIVLQFVKDFHFIRDLPLCQEACTHPYWP